MNEELKKYYDLLVSDGVLPQTVSFESFEKKLSTEEGKKNYHNLLVSDGVLPQEVDYNTWSGKLFSQAKPTQQDNMLRVNQKPETEAQPLSLSNLTQEQQAAATEIDKQNPTENLQEKRRLDEDNILRNIQKLKKEGKPTIELEDEFLKLGKLSDEDYFAVKGQKERRENPALNFAYQTQALEKAAKDVELPLEQVLDIRRNIQANMFLSDESQKEEYNFVQQLKDIDKELQQRGKTRDEKLAKGQATTPEENARFEELANAREEAEKQLKQAKQVQQANINSEIAKQVVALETATGEDRVAIKQKIDALNASKKDLLKPEYVKVQEANQTIEQAFPTIDQQMPEGLTPHQKFDRYYQTLYQEYADLKQRTGGNDESVMGNVKGALQRAGVNQDEDTKRLYELEQVLRATAPIALLNKSQRLAENRDDFFSSFGKSFAQSLSPQAKASATYMKETQAAQALDKVLKDTGLDKFVESGTQGIIEKQAKEPEMISAEGLGGISGTSAGFILPFMIGTGAVNATKIGRALSVLEGSTVNAQKLNLMRSVPMLRNAYGLAAAKTGSNILKQGLIYETTGQIFENQKEEANFLSGAGGQAAVEAVIGTGTGLNSVLAMFGNKGKVAAAFLSKMARQFAANPEAKGLTAKGLGTAMARSSVAEIPEETAQEFVQIYQQSDNFGKALNEFTKRYGTLSKYGEFALAVALSSGGMGVGSYLGENLSNKYQEIKKQLPKEDVENLQAMEQGLAKATTESAANLLQENAEKVKTKLAEQGIEPPTTEQEITPTEEQDEVEVGQTIEWNGEQVVPKEKVAELESQIAEQQDIADDPTQEDSVREEADKKVAEIEKELTTLQESREYQKYLELSELDKDLAELEDEANPTEEVVEQTTTSTEPPVAATPVAKARLTASQEKMKGQFMANINAINNEASPEKREQLLNDFMATTSTVASGKGETRTYTEPEVESQKQFINNALETLNAKGSKSKPELLANKIANEFDSRFEIQKDSKGKWQATFDGEILQPKVKEPEIKLSPKDVTDTFVAADPRDSNYTQIVANESTNPQEIESAIATEQANLEGLKTSRQNAIAEKLATVRVKTQSFDNVKGSAARKGAILATNYLSSDGQGLDTIAQELTSEYFNRVGNVTDEDGQPFTEEEIADFITENQKGVNSFLKGQQETLNKLQKRLKQLTKGKPKTDAELADLQEPEFDNEEFFAEDFEPISQEEFEKNYENLPLFDENGNIELPKLQELAKTNVEQTAGLLQVPAEEIDADFLAEVFAEKDKLKQKTQKRNENITKQETGTRIAKESSTDSSKKKAKQEVEDETTTEETNKQEANRTESEGKAEQLSNENIKFAQIGIAPERDNTIDKFDEAEQVFKSKAYNEYYTETLPNIAAAVGIKIGETVKTVGGYFLQDQQKAIKEPSVNILFGNKDATEEQLEDFAVLAAALAPEVQESVMKVMFAKDGKDTLYSFFVDNNQAAENIVTALNEAGIVAYSYDPQAKVIYVADIDNQNYQNIKTIIKDGKAQGSITRTESAEANTSFINEGRYEERISGIRSRRRNGEINTEGESSNLESLTRRAEERVKEHLAEKAKVKQGKGFLEKAIDLLDETIEATKSNKNLNAFLLPIPIKPITIGVLKLIKAGLIAGKKLAELGAEIKEFLENRQEYKDGLYTATQIADSVAYALKYAKPFIEQANEKALQEKTKTPEIEGIKTEEAKKEPEEDEVPPSKKRERGLSKQIRNKVAVPKLLQEQIQKAPLLYEQIANKATLAEAQAELLEQVKTEEGYAELIDEITASSKIANSGTPIQNAKAFIMVQMLDDLAQQTTDETEKAQYTELAREIFERTSERLTIGGQATQIAAAFSGILANSEELVIASLEKAMQRFRNADLNKAKVEKANREAEKLRKEIDEEWKKKVDLILNLSAKLTKEQKEAYEAALAAKEKSWFEKFEQYKKDIATGAKKARAGAKAKMTATFEELTKDNKIFTTDTIKTGIADVKAFFSGKSGKTFGGAAIVGLPFGIVLNMAMFSGAVIEGLIRKGTTKMFEEFSEVAKENYGGKVSPYLQDMFNMGLDEVESRGIDTTGIAREVKPKKTKKPINSDSLKAIIAKLTEQGAISTDILIAELENNYGVDSATASVIAKQLEDFIAKAQAKIAKKAKKSEPKEQKTLQDDILARWASGENIADNAEFAKEYGLPAANVSDEVRKEIGRLTEAVKNSPEGFLQNRATKELQDYLAKQFPSSTWDYWWAMYYPAILSGVSTQAINTISGMATTFSQGLAMTGVALANKDVQEVRAVIASFFRSMPTAFLQAYDIMARGEDGGNNTVGILGKENIKASSDMIRKRNTEDLAKELDSKNPMKYWFSMLKYVGRFMAATDTFAYYANQDMTLSALAIQRKRAEGLTGQELYKAVMTSLYDGEFDKAKEQAITEVLGKGKTEADVESATPRQKTDIARRTREIIKQQGTTTLEREEAKAIGLLNTFKSKPTGFLGYIATMIDGWINKNNATRALGKLGLGVDFMRTTINIVNLSLDYSPYGLIRAYKPTISNAIPIFTPFGDIIKQAGIESSTQGTAGSYSRKLQVSKAAIGSLAILAVALLAGGDDEEEFDITGAGELNFNKNLNKSNIRPNNSIKLFGKWFNYTQIPILNIACQLVGNHKDFIRNGGDEEEGLMRYALALTTTIKSTLVDATPYRSVQESFRQMPNNADDNLLDKYLKFAQEKAVKTGTSLIPNAYKQMVRLYDPTVYTPKEIEGMFLKHAGLIQFVDDKGQYVKRDVFGREVKFYPSENFIPVQYWTGEKGNTPIDKLVFEKLQMSGLTPVGQKTNIVVNGESRKVGENKAWYQFYMQRAGQIFYKSISDNYKEIDKMPKEEAVKYIQKLRDFANKQAKGELMDKIDDKKL